jgi:hypothetical protein
MTEATAKRPPLVKVRRMRVRVFIDVDTRSDPHPAPLPVGEGFEAQAPRVPFSHRQKVLDLHEPSMQ